MATNTGGRPEGHAHHTSAMERDLPFGSLCVHILRFTTRFKDAPLRQWMGVPLVSLRTLMAPAAPHQSWAWTPESSVDKGVGAGHPFDRGRWVGTLLALNATELTQNAATPSCNFWRIEVGVGRSCYCLDHLAQSNIFMPTHHFYVGGAACFHAGQAARGPPSVAT